MAVNLGDVEFDVNARTQNLAGSQAAVERFGAAVERANNRILASQARVARGHADFQSAVVGTNRTTSRFITTLQDLSSASVLAIGPLSGVGARITALGAILTRSQLQMALWLGGITAVTVALTSMARNAVTTGIAFDRINQRLITLTGGTTAAQVELEQIRDLADRTGTSFITLAEQFTRLATASTGTALEGQRIRQVFEDITFAAGKFQLSGEEVQGVFRAIEQIMSKGTVQAEELRGQLGDRLVGAFNAAATAMGVTTVELNKMLEQGELLASEFLPKFAAEIRRSFGADTIDRIESTRASIERFRNATIDFSITFDQTFGVTETFRGALERLTEVITDVTDNIRQVTIVLGTLAGAFVGLAIPRIISAFLALGRAIGVATAALIGLNAAAAASPIAGLGRILLRLGLGAGAATGSFYLMQEAMDSLGDSTGDLTSRVNEYLSSQEEVRRASIGTTDVLISQVETRIKAAEKQITALTDLANSDITLPTPLEDVFERFRAGESARPGDLEALFSDPTGIDQAQSIGKARVQIQTLMDNIADYREQLTLLNELRDKQAADERKRLNLGTGGDETLSRQDRALRNANEQLERMAANIAALQGGARSVEIFGVQQEQLEKIDAFRKSLEGAGVAQSVVNEKVKEFTELLDLTRQAEAAFAGVNQFANAIRDNLGSALDQVGQSLVDMAFEGKDALESLVDIAKKAAKDIANEFIQLALINPLKNALFNPATPFATLGFGVGGGTGGLGLGAGGFDLGSIFGFAGGGQFRVGGQGGTDSQLVRFKASPDETVTITRPGQSIGGGGNTYISVENHSNEPIQAGERRRIGRDTHQKLIIGTVNAGFTRGQLDQGLGVRTGISPQLVTR